MSKLFEIQSLHLFSIIKRNITILFGVDYNNMETSHSVIIIHLNGMKFSTSFYYKQIAIA